MNSNGRILRRAVLAALLVAVAAGTGCSWFRGKSGYENSPESRPLEVPPDLDQPVQDPSMTVPAVSGTSAPVAASQAAVTGTPFVLDDALDGAWRRVGLALERIDGVTMGERAEVLSVYNVTFEGETFLIKLASEGDGTRVSALSQDGPELTTGAAGKLLAQLRMRLT
jgi:uncharacterized lipoprotein